jgi:hypothetical protein
MKALKYLKHLTIIYLLCLLYPSCCVHAASVLVTGVVKDSLTLQPLSGVKVECPSPVCSTKTNAQGQYSITIVTTAARQPLPAMARTLPQAESRYFSLSGRSVKSNTAFSRGIYLIYSQGKISKVLNVDCRSPEKRGIVESSALAKTLASFVFTYSFAGYNTATRTVTGSATVNPLLVPKVVPSDSSKANIKITTDPVDTLTGTVIFN